MTSETINLTRKLSLAGSKRHFRFSLIVVTNTVYNTVIRKEKKNRNMMNYIEKMNGEKPQEAIDFYYLSISKLKNTEVNFTHLSASKNGFPIQTFHWLVLFA